jgi:hypothetical protein
MRPRRHRQRPGRGQRPFPAANGVLDQFRGREILIVPRLPPRSRRERSSFGLNATVQLRACETWSYALHAHDPRPSVARSWYHNAPF